MCGIVGAVAERNVLPILLEGLKRLEYRGYDSAGAAVIDADGHLERQRVQGKVAELEQRVASNPLPGKIGIAHTRWATHGEPSVSNAHPHVSADRVALVHNGIIENHAALRDELTAAGYRFESQTDTEVVVHEIERQLKPHPDLLVAVRAATERLVGAYALAVMAISAPDRLIVARRGSPLVIGVGLGEHFIASDVFALLPVTQRFMFLEDGDIAEVRRERVTIYNAAGERVERPVVTSSVSADAAEKSGYRHFMQKEIHMQPRAVADTLEGRLLGGRVVDAMLGPSAEAILADTRQVQIIACGTSFHAGLVAKYWFEGLAGIPCAVEVASEYRYRSPVVGPNTLVVTISQSGETADTLAALKAAQQAGCAHSLAICNVPESSLTRESEAVLMTRAGPEIGVASTKAFTTQLVALLLLVLALGRRNGLTSEREQEIVADLEKVPGLINQLLELDADIERLSEAFVDKEHALFLGRGTMYPVAMEGALKLKEISYIHAEAYPAGELKHGPLALVDEDMPVVSVAPNNELLEKLSSNLEEVRARGGRLFVFADVNTDFQRHPENTALPILHVSDVVAPIIYTVPLQMLAYHVAVLRGADVDQPRNLAKSVTVE